MSTVPSHVLGSFLLTHCVFVVQGLEGELVWGQVEGFSLWPAIIIPCREEDPPPGKKMVSWFGQRMVTQVSHFYTAVLQTPFSQQ